MSVSSWWLALSTASIFFSLRFFKKDKLASITLLYTLLSAISVLALKRYPHAPEQIQQVLMCTSLWGVLAIFAVVIVATHIPKRLIFDAAIYALSFSNAVYVIFNAVFFPVSIGNHGFTGFILNASMNGCLIAVGAATAIKEKAWLGLCIIVIAVTLSLSSVPIGVLCVSLSAYLICRLRGKGVLKWLLVVAVASLICGLVSSGEYLFNSAGRFEAYKIFMTEWWQRGMILFGTGIGTFQAMAPQMQAKYNFMMQQNGEGHYWPSMHSDWLQCLFELGVVGLILYIALFYKTMKTLYENNEGVSFSVLAGIGSTALFNYPFRYAVFGVIAVYIVRLSGTTTDRINTLS